MPDLPACLHFSDGLSHPAHAEPDVGCVAPRRRTRFLLLNKSAHFPKPATACVAAPHTLPERQRPSENAVSTKPKNETRFSDGLCRAVSPQPQLPKLRGSRAVVAEGFDKRQDLVAVVGRRTLGEGGVEGVEAGQAVDAGRAVDPAVGQAGE